jgi:hypothetical protein
MTNEQVADELDDIALNFSANYWKLDIRHEKGCNFCGQTDKVLEKITWNLQCAAQTFRENNVEGALNFLRRARNIELMFWDGEGEATRLFLKYTQSKESL